MREARVRGVLRRAARALAALLVALVLLPGRSGAHEARPASLEIDETAPGAFTVVWKQPTLGDVAIHLRPHLSNGWLERPPADQYAAPGYLIRTWRIAGVGRAPLAGRTVAVEGLADTLTDVLVRVRLRDGRTAQAILRPERPEAGLALADGAAATAAGFFVLGLQHILTGPDHLLFVLGLVLIVRSRWALLKTASAFTLAHSLTLAAAAFGLVRVPAALTGALVGLSILFLAPEVLRARRGGTSLTLRRPWAAAFGFGLLHGLGFAGGLAGLGLAGGALLGALLAFNLGVEAGQVAFIALVLALMRAFRLMRIRWPTPAALAPAYLLGALGAFWSLQYAALALGGAP